MSGHGGDDGGLPEEHEEHVNHEAWVIPYADLLTLLMAMFIALFAVSNVDSAKFKALSRGFSTALGGGKLDSGIGGSGKATSPVVGAGNGEGPFAGGSLMPSQSSADMNKLTSILASLQNQKKAQQQSQQQLQDLQTQIDNAAKGLGLPAGTVQTKQLDNGLEITLLTDKILFSSGSASVQVDGLPLLGVIAQVLKTIDNNIQINGYTDTDPIHSSQFSDNSVLSYARAHAVASFFVAQGIDLNRLFPTGLGERNPIASNANEVGKAENRRVEIIVQSKLVKKTLEDAGLTDKVSTPTTQPIGDSGAVPNLNPGLDGK